MLRRSHRFGKLALVAVLAVLAVGPVVTQTLASGEFNGAHWARTTNILKLDLGNELSGDWNKYLKRAANEWSESKVVDLDIVGSPGGCEMERGRVEVCNGSYRNENWLGLTIADIRDRHIYRAAVLMNDYYFDQSRYDRTDAKRHTMCQEVGHSMGLDHRYSKTCMNDREIFGRAYDSPSNADYRELEQLYDHQDRDSTVDSAGAASTSAAAEPAEPVDAALVEDAVRKAKAARDGKGEATVVEDLGGGRSRLIHVTFVDDAAPAG
jgi:hypothetical protein